MDEEKIMDMVRGIEKNANVNAAFGEPKVVGDKTIIPISSVWYGYGFGFGEMEREKGGERSLEHEVGGAGGGGGAKVVPIGYLEVTPNNAKFVGTADTNKLAIMGMTMMMWNVFWVTRTIRAGMSRKHMAVLKGISLPQIPEINPKLVKKMVKQGLWKRLGKNTI